MQAIFADDEHRYCYYLHNFGICWGNWCIIGGTIPMSMKKLGVLQLERNRVTNNSWKINYFDNTSGVETDLRIMTILFNDLVTKIINCVVPLFFMFVCKNLLFQKKKKKQPMIFH